jgi:hypothetical protein
VGKKTPRRAAASNKRRGGQIGARGYLVQTLIALRDLLDDQHPWTSVTFEPNIVSDQAAPDQPPSDQADADKVDILWRYREGTRAVQVKSSQNPFRRADIERWAAELERWQQADRYELVLVGQCDSAATANIRRVGQVEISRAVNLDLQAFLE